MNAVMDDCFQQFCTYLKDINLWLLKFENMIENDAMCQENNTTKALNYNNKLLQLTCGCQIDGRTIVIESRSRKMNWGQFIQQ
ncbi:CLUMA_CG010961, isoform A [Clunio marinus]|uniref:CLUMA_CG010961, isoform A n=1 Tax=Clunio marinus TaxID=568069 RepID=A0A1J1IBA6_9DIPT|nr:CLUMA_CG010961, isoform A [Clunio marinus]